MRENKFRAFLWSEQHTNDQWIYSDQIGMLKFWQNYYLWQGNKKLMQYTGLKDIYEGDLVRNKYFHCLLIVKYDPERMAFVLQPSNLHFCDSGKIQGYTCSRVVLKACVVIGNIHDNPELLKVGEIDE